jgi:prepilin-type N-terminal cleavage/methylation domain-containing protein
MNRRWSFAKEVAHRANARALRHIRRDGMTLIEMLLALGVLGILAALSWPSVLRIHNEQKLVDAAEKVRSLAAVARVNAIESGLAYQFRHEQDGTHFIVVPFEREFEAVDPRTQGAGTAEGLGRFSKGSNELPKGVKFGASRISTATSSGTTTSAAGGFTAASSTMPTD